MHTRKRAPPKAEATPPPSTTRHGRAEEVLMLRVPTDYRTTGLTREETTEKKTSTLDRSADPIHSHVRPRCWTLTLSTSPASKFTSNSWLGVALVQQNRTEIRQTCCSLQCKIQPTPTRVWEHMYTDLVFFRLPRLSSENIIFNAIRYCTYI